MPYSLEVRYYNSYWLKQVTTPLITAYSETELPSAADVKDSKGVGYFKVFPGWPWERNNNPNTFINQSRVNEFRQNWPVATENPTYNPIAFKSNVNSVPSSNFSESFGSNWVIEESRIKGSFNGAQVDLGVRAYLREDSNEAVRRDNALIYSGVYNSVNDVNNTNVFSIAEDITKAVDPSFGSIQLVYAMDSNLTIFQENKVSTAMIDKDAIYSAEGTPMTTQTDVVIGQVTPYTGEYGISRDPESFALHGFRRYFTDRYRNAVLRLSRDGITEISNHGMKDFFRDKLSEISEIPTVEVSNVYPIDVNSIAGDGVFHNAQVWEDWGQGVAENVNEAIRDKVYIGDGNLGYYMILDPDNDNVEEFENVIGSTIQINYDYLGDPSNFVDLGCEVSSIGFVDSISPQNNVKETSKALFITKPNTLPSDTQFPGGVMVKFKNFTKDKIVGGFDNYNDNYILSIQKASTSKTPDVLGDNYITVNFDEVVKGWTTFYSFKPNNIFSLKNNFYTDVKGAEVYKHHSDISNHGSFYGVENPSSITFIINGNPSISKNFKSVSYEGSDGWQLDSFESDVIYSTKDSNSATIEARDEAQKILSYKEGLYFDNGNLKRVGFNRKNNKYYGYLKAKLREDSSKYDGMVLNQDQVSGVNGFFARVKMSTDQSTSVGKVKELFAVSTEFVTHNS